MHERACHAEETVPRPMTHRRLTLSHTCLRTLFDDRLFVHARTRRNPAAREPGIFAYLCWRWFISPPLESRQRGLDPATSTGVPISAPRRRRFGLLLPTLSLLEAPQESSRRRAAPNSS